MSGVKMALEGGGTPLADDGGNDGTAKVNLPPVIGRAGYVVSAAEVDDGTVLPSRLLRVGEVSLDSRQRIGMDTPMIDLSFAGATIQTSVINILTSGMTCTQVAGRLVLNGGNAFAATNRAQVQTQRTVPLFASFPSYGEGWFSEPNWDATNAISEIGFGYPGGGVVAPTDGVFLRRIGGGELRGVVSYAGAEAFVVLDMTDALNFSGSGAYTPDDVNHWVVTINNDQVEFWCNRILINTISRFVATGSPASSSCLPMFARVYVPTGLSASAGRRIEIAYLGGSIGDMNMNQSFWMTSAAMGRGAYQTQQGVAAGQTANAVNNTAPALATLSNTTAGYPTLGGQFKFNAVAGGETDYALFAYLVPVGTNIVEGRTLHITGVRIGEVYVEGAAIATSPTIFQWAVAVGATAVSLATVDGSATTSPKRKLLGSQSFPVGDPVGAIKAGFDNDLGMAAPHGTYVHIILKVVSGAATASQTFRGTVAIDGYFL